MYPTENMSRKTDVDIIEYMLELQEIYKKVSKWKLKNFTTII